MQLWEVTMEKLRTYFHK